MALFREKSLDLLAVARAVTPEGSVLGPSCRHIDGHVVPAPGTWVFDPRRCQIAATIRHAMLTKVVGRFALRSGSVVVGDDLFASRATVVIDAASIDTGDANRDEHLRDAGRLDVARYPDITFAGTELRPHHAGHAGAWALTGDLTIGGQTQRMEVIFKLDKLIVTPSGVPEMALSAVAVVDRGAFGLTWNQVLETGGFVLGKTVSIGCAVVAVRNPQHSCRPDRSRSLHGTSDQPPPAA